MKNSYEIKIFQIDRNQYEIRDLDILKTISEIISQHKNRLKITDSNSLNYKNDRITYCSYVFNEDVKDSYWKNFLPYELSHIHDFDIKQISFVLFCGIGSNLFAIVGGSGIRVIKKFLNDRFGIDLFERFMNPNEDLVISHVSRGILGNLSENRKVYRNDKYLNEAFDVTDVPTKLVVRLRQEIKDSLFDFIKFSSNTSVVEVGSYFFLKIRVDFDSLHELIRKIDEILRYPKSGNLTSFVKIEDQSLITNSLEMNLFSEIYNDLGNKFNPNPLKIHFNEKDIDFIHPSNLIGFYECDKYEIEVSHQKKLTRVVYDRESLYLECLKVLEHQIGVPQDLFTFIKFLRRIRIKGYRNNELETQARFFDHITSEILYNNRPYFKIDNVWYEVKNDFISHINTICIDYYKKYEFTDTSILKQWSQGVVEGDYNAYYRGSKGFYVFDKLLNDNIEMCDLLYIDDVTRKIYLFHVKDGFDAKMRDLYNQIILSSQRLTSDIKNSKQSEYLEGQIARFNKVEANKNKNISLVFQDVYKILVDHTYEKTIIMAFKSSKNSSSDTFDKRLVRLKSNIAKYALVQTVKEIEDFNFRIIDLADL